MSEIIRMKSVEPVVYGVVKITWLDGFEAVVDLRSVIADGEIAVGDRIAISRQPEPALNSATPLWPRSRE